MNEQKERLRQPPCERFLAASHVFDLAQVLTELRAEHHAGQSGHRQVAILHHGPVTQVVIDFEAGGHLEHHAVYGLVSIHVLEGQLSVESEGQEQPLRAGQMLVLKPDVVFNVRAIEAGALLLTVHLEGHKAPAANG